MPGPAVLVLEGVTGPAIDALEAEFGMLRATTLSEIGDGIGIRALVVRNQTRVDGSVLERLPRLEVVARAGVGLDNIDVPALSTAGVVVTYAPGRNAVSTAEHTLALALALSRRVAELDREVRTGAWNRRAGRQLAGSAWGVVGHGRIGRLVAGLARAIGMRVVVHDPAVADSAAAPRDVAFVGLGELLAMSRVVSLHTPLSRATRHLIGAPQLATMRADGILVNTGRGGLVDEAALLGALRCGQIAGAALDVREQEPPPVPDPFAALDQVVLTPHVAAHTPEAQAHVLGAIAEEIRTILSGGAAETYANFASPLRQA